MTGRQHKFVQYYLLELNATKAAAMAGYANGRNYGWELLMHPEVQAAIQEERRKMAARHELSQDFVLNGLLENYRRAMQVIPVLDKEGVPIGEYTYNGSVANRSLELIGKYFGMFDDRLRLEFVAADDFLAVLTGLLTAVKENVTDQDARKRIQDRYNQLLLSYSKVGLDAVARPVDASTGNDE